jgi:hypothetical protein
MQNAALIREALVPGEGTVRVDLDALGAGINERPKQ